MILSYRYRLLPTRRQHRALEEILEAQRQLYNAALQERVDAYRKAGILRTYFAQTKALTEWRQSDPEARSLPVYLQRGTLARLGALARKQRSSRGRRIAKSRLARCHHAVARRRKEHLHQASARLIRDYDLIAVEQLHVKDMAHGRLAGDIRDASWAKFISMLRYKAARAGAGLIEVDPRNTSQDCSGCGKRVPRDLKTRHHECPFCALSIDRDLNAALNILNRAGVGPGLRNVAGCGMRAGGNIGDQGAVSPEPPRHYPL